MNVKTLKRKNFECVDFIEKKAGVQVAKNFIINNLDGSVDLKEKKEYIFIKFGTAAQKGGFYKPTIEVIKDIYLKETNDFIVLKTCKINKNNLKAIIYR